MRTHLPRRALAGAALLLAITGALAADSPQERLSAAEADNLAGRNQDCITKVRGVLAEEDLERTLRAKAHSIAANCLSTAARFDEAVSDISEAIRLAEADGPSLELGRAYRILGNIHARSGAIDSAIVAYQASVDILTQSDEATEAAYGQVNLASNLLRVGRYLEALDQIERASNVLSSIESPLLLNARYVEATARMMMGDFESATPIFEDLREQATSLNRIDLQVGSTQALAYGPARLGRFAEALTFHEAALSIIKGLPAGALLGFEIETLFNTADLYNRNGEIEKATEVASRLDRLVDSAPQPYFLAMRDRVLGNLARSTGEQEAAISRLIDSVDGFHQGGHLELAIESLFDLCAASPPDEVPFGARVCQLALNVHSAWRGDAASKTGSQTSLTMLIGLRSYYERAITYLLEAGRVFEAIGAIGLLHEIEIDHWQSLHPASPDSERIPPLPLVIDAELSEAVALMMRKPQAIQRGGTIAELLRSQRDRLKAAPSDTQVADNPPSWLTCTGCERLIYLQTDEVLWIIAVTDGRLNVTRQALSRVELDELVLEARRSLQDPDSRPERLMGELGTLLLPDGAVMNDERNRALHVIADGALRQLPFAALRRENRYVGVERPVIMETFNSLLRKQKPWRRPSFVHAFGASQGAGDLPPLPDVALELQSVLQPRTLGSGFDGNTWLDQSFTVDKLKGPWQEHAVVHLASHFVLSARSESLSYLLTGDGSRIELARFAELGVNFHNVPLVMLSACNTGLALTNRFGREVEGLAGVARRLGANRIVASLWPVADQGTSAFVRFFYAALASGEPPSVALTTARARSTQGATLLERLLTPFGVGGPADPHPNVWASFVVYE